MLLQALLWFKSPPRYFARCTRRAAAEQVAALETFTQELTKTLKMGVRYAGKGSGSPGDLAWPSYRSPAAAELGRASGVVLLRSLQGAEQPENSHVGVGSVGHCLAAAISSLSMKLLALLVVSAGVLTAAAEARPHPVWGTAAPEVARYIRLLQYLCGEELNRLHVWTDPLKHADSARQLPVVRSSWLNRSCGSCWPASGPGQEQQAASCSKVASLGRVVVLVFVYMRPLKLPSQMTRAQWLLCVVVFACRSQSPLQRVLLESAWLTSFAHFVPVPVPVCACCRCVGRSMWRLLGRLTPPWHSACRTTSQPTATSSRPWSSWWWSTLTQPRCGRNTCVWLHAAQPQG